MEADNDVSERNMLPPSSNYPVSHIEHHPWKHPKWCRYYVVAVVFRFVVYIGN
jgi:hypothetical protein